MVGILEGNLEATASRQAQQRQIFESDVLFEMHSTQTNRRSLHLRGFQQAVSAKVRVNVYRP